MGRENSGYVIEMEDGRRARTYHNKPSPVKGKAAVFMCLEEKEYGGEVVNGKKHPKIKVCTKYAEQATLVDPAKTKIIGFID